MAQAATTGSVPTRNIVKEAYQASARVTEAEARTKASEAYPGGTVESAKLESEHGSLVYSVNVRSKSGKKDEVLIDAGNGQVLSQHDGENGDDEEDGDDD